MYSMLSGLSDAKEKEENQSEDEAVVKLVERKLSL